VKDCFICIRKERSLDRKACGVGDSRMNVLMVISQFKPIIGGAEKQAELLAHALVRKGINVTIVTGWLRPGTPRKEIVDGMRIVRNFSCLRLFGAEKNLIVRILGGISYVISLAMFLVKHGREYDILHVHQVLYPAFISAFIGKGLLKKPILAKMGCSGLTSDIRNIKRFALGGLQLRYLIKKMDCVVTVNHEGVEDFRALGYPLSKIHHIPNGVASPRDGKTNYDNVRSVITTVRLDHQKGLDILLRAWVQVGGREKDVRLLIIGKGPHELELKKLSKTLGFGDSVIFMGEVNHVEEYLKTSDIFVLASRAEGMSNALLEAMSHGLTCIATNISGNVELMGTGDGHDIPRGEFTIVRNGLLVEPEDIEGLAKAILFLIQNQRARKDLGEKGRKHVEQNYSIDLIAEKYIRLYRDLLQELN